MNDFENEAIIFPAINDIPEEILINELIEEHKYLVNGEIRIWNGPEKDVFSPIYIKSDKGIDRKLLGRYSLLTEKESLEILESAVSAYDNGKGIWPTMPIIERIKHLEEFAFLMKKNRENIVKLLMWEICKSKKDSEKEFDRTINYIIDTIDAVKDLDRISSRFTITDGVIAQIRRAPLGVVLCMGPFNYPINETFTTLIPALIMGNTIILKPPKHGILIYNYFIEIFNKAFPKGVVNTIYGEGHTVIPPLMNSGKINVLAFIGTSKVANDLKKQHPKPHSLRCILGLEAKNAGIILPDADINLTVRECLLGTLSFNGQRCTALKILFVHKDIADKFLNEFSKGVDELKIGMPWEEGVKITPLPEPNKPSYHRDLVEDALKNGAKVINSKGGTVDKSFFYPSILYPVNSKMRAYYEEQFGPVIPIVPYSTIEEPIQYIIDSNYGQQASIFGNNPDQIAKLVDILVNQVCRVNINSQCQRDPDTFPFTGRKDSAEGTLSVTDALRVFSIRTLVAAKETDENKLIIENIIQERKSKFLSTDFIF